MISMQVNDDNIFEMFRKEQLSSNGIKTPKEFINRMYLKIGPRAFRKRYHEWCREHGINPSVEAVHYIHYLGDNLLETDELEKSLAEYSKLKNIFSSLDPATRDENTEMAIASVVVSKTTGRKIEDIIRAFTPTLPNMSSQMAIIKRKSNEIRKLLSDLAWKVSK